MPSLLALAALLLLGVVSSVSAQGTANFTTTFVGGLPFCSQCGTPGQYACSPDANGQALGQWNNGVISFTDPIPIGNYATKITITITGAYSCNVVGSRAVFAAVLNNYAHAVRDTTKGVNSCKCDTCDGVETFNLVFRNGVPNYNYRSTNSLKIDVYRDSICINKIDVAISYVPILTSPPTPLPEAFFNVPIPGGYDRVGCPVCNRDQKQWCTTNSNNSVTLTFKDPLPANSLLVSIDVYFSLGMVERAITSYSVIRSSVQGTAVGTSVTIVDAAFRDKCQCLADYVLSSDTYQRGWPSYVYNGGSNRLTLTLDKYSQSYGNVCVGRLNVKLIYFKLVDDVEFDVQTAFLENLQIE